MRFLLHIRLLDHLERPIPGYSARVTQSGFQTPIEWKNPACFLIACACILATKA